MIATSAEPTLFDLAGIHASQLHNLAQHVREQIDDCDKQLGPLHGERTYLTVVRVLAKQAESHSHIRKQAGFEAGEASGIVQDIDRRISRIDAEDAQLAGKGASLAQQLKLVIVAQRGAPATYYV